MTDPLDFSGKTVLVTGSSRGIGAGILTALAHRGARCIVNYVDDPQGRNKSDAESVAATIRNATILQCDVSDNSQVQAMADAIRKDFGGLEILVNNAGILRDKSIRKMSPDEFESVLRVNLFGAFNVIQKLIELIKPDGRLINMASVAGTLGFFGQANYAASKAGLIALTKVAARELARNRITANAIAPGFIDTEMTKGMPDDVMKKFVEQIPLGRFGQIDDIVGAVLFLSSPLASYVTGQVIHVNGGFYMGTA
ncbi:MAG: 3-oxoacyl-ACP reductase family protein [Tepidisphaeraceae bacterium]